MAEKGENLKKTYITRMPDKAGAFLVAGNIISSHKGNIVRVNYNKAVDTHTLFIDVEASAQAHREIQKELEECGYISDSNLKGQPEILMIVLTLKDEPGSVKPVLEILNSHKVNISYISSQENGSPYQYFKMGLLIENTKEISTLIEEISKICEIKILDYEVTDRLLDGTVFYISFANEMRKILNLNQSQTNEVLVYANQMMQILDEQKKSPLKTFDYIRRFASMVVSRKGENFKPDVSFINLNRGITLFIIEPPCGSNTYILAKNSHEESQTIEGKEGSGGQAGSQIFSQTGSQIGEQNSELLFIDSGFSCYQEEMKKILKGLFPDFDSRKKTGIITHADQDHAGLMDLMEKNYMSASCYENFRLEKEGLENFREQNPFHKPYCSLSKIISGYKTPDLEKCQAFKKRQSQELFELVSSQNFFGLNFDIYEGMGGHVRGDTIIVCPELKLLFSGDIYVNIKGFSNEQKEFNALAPFLMTGVDSDSPLAKKSREYILEKFSDYIICPGHGAVKTV